MHDYNSNDAYVLPSKDFLKTGKENSIISNDDQREMKTTCQILVNTFASFGIRIIPEEILRGPTLTLYEFSYPVQKKSISTLAKYKQDIARVTQSQQVKFLLPIPSKNTIGIEIANKERLFVSLGDVVNSDEFTTSSIHVPIPLGKDMQGRPVIRDLTTMPHLLVAGNAGSDTSAFIDSIISSFLLKFRPKELRLILVDTYFTSFLPFTKLPHLIFPLTTNDHKKTGTVLNWCIHEMEYRYQCFSTAGVSDIQAFNERKTNNSPLAQSKISHDAPQIGPFLQENMPEDFPYIVIIIKDLDDLMQDDRKAKEYNILQLTRIGHTAGIHLIVTCRNPTDEILTPAIKTSFQARVSFHVHSKTVSHLILDRKGAENLLGEGDMLYVEAISTREERIQKPFISDDEIRILTDYCSSQIPPIINTKGNQKVNQEISSEEEKCYLKSLEVALIEGKISTSLLHRRLSVGYGRAARMMDLLENRGIIAPADNTNCPRKVLKP